tara:strand:+ start:8564 stop:9634 length:1071 start_codon:yes stop_codon:yes gene_type:complete
MSQNYISPTTSPTSNPAADQPKVADNDAALRSNFSGAVAPVSPVACQSWFDSTNDMYYIRNTANSEWMAINGKLTIRITSVYEITKEDNNRTLIITDGPYNITLPQDDLMPEGYNVSLIFNDNAAYTFISNPSSSLGFIRDALTKTTFNMVNQLNSRVYINNYTKGGQLILAGALSTGSGGTVNLTDAAKLVILNLTQPVGSDIEMWFDGSGSVPTPPMDGVLGVSWTTMAAGLLKLTSSEAFVGTTNIGGSFAYDLDTSADLLHAFHLPPHQHTYPHFLENKASTAVTAIYGIAAVKGDNGILPRYDSIKNVNDVHTVRGFSTSTANNLPPASQTAHGHTCNIKSLKVITYKRIS